MNEELDRAADAFSNVIPNLLSMLNQEFAKLWGVPPTDVGIVLLVNRREQGFIGTNFANDGSLGRVMRGCLEQIDQVETVNVTHVAH